MQRTLTRRLIIATSILLIWVVVAWLSSRSAYLPTKSLRYFFLLVLPILLVVTFLIFSFYCKAHGKRAWFYMIGDARGKASIVRGSQLIVLVVLLCVVISGANSRILAWPTEFFAASTFNAIQHVDHIGHYRYESTGLSRVSLSDQEFGGSYFVWKTSDPELVRIEQAGCLRIIGRRWFAGVFVEEIMATNCPPDM
jgi:hypothetical protein